MWDLPKLAILKVFLVLKCLLVCVRVSRQKKYSGSEMDHPKLEYLGSGIDGRMPPESWLDTLDGKRTKLREVDLDKNIQITEVDKTKSAQTSKSKKRSTKAGGHAGLKPHQSLGLEGKLTAMRDTSKYSKHSEFQKTTKIAWMIEETSRDPENITRAREGKPPIHYTKYERELSGFILEHVEVKQEEERRRGTGATDIPPIKDLEGEDDVDKLNKYIHDLQSQPNSKSRQKIWQEIASACWMFLNKKRYTHYVDSIHLGASIHASVTAQHSKTGFLAGAGAKGMEFVDAGAEVGHQRESSSVSKIRVTRGTIESDVVTSEEVIKASLSPVTDLINDKSKELMVVMKSLMRAYTRTHGTEMGPLQISCRKLQGEEVQIIYWKVSGEHIHGTTAAHQASQFYIKRKDDKTFTISHKPDGVTTQSVTFQELQPEERAYSPLKLVRSANVSFSLKNVDKKKSVQLPPTEMDWKERSPFFIKPYKQTSVRCTVVVEQYQQPGTKYTIATCASKDGEDGLMLFYFEPAIKNLPGVTLGHGSSGPPPPPRPSPSPTIRPSRIESDSGTPDTEPVPPPPPPPLDKINPGATPKHDQDDIDRIFTELVGDDYVFPI